MTEVGAKEYNILLPKEGVIGKIVELEYNPNTVLLFQVPIPTAQMSKDYREKAFVALKAVLPESMQAMLIGNDINIYEILESDAVVLRLKGEA